MAKYSIGAFLFLILVVSATAGNCLPSALPIGEKDLLEPETRWPSMQKIDDSLRTTFLTAAGFADSTGEVPSNIAVNIIDRCPYTYGGAEGIDLLILLVRGREGDKDENVYLATLRNRSIIGRSLIAQLQTTCSTTFLRGCTMLEDGTIQIQQLEHSFECGTDEFKGTQNLPAFQVWMRDDGTFEEVMSE